MMSTEKHSIFFSIILLISIANIVFYPFLKKYGYIDEGLVVLLMLGTFTKVRTYLACKEFRVFLLLMLFYLVCSLVKKVNVPQATVRDFFIFLKPFICFYSCYLLGGQFSSRIKFLCKCACLLMGVYLWYILPMIGSLYENTTAYYPGCVFAAVGYLVFSKRKRNDWLIATFLILPGMASIRAKFFTELIVWFGILFFVKNHIRINIKYLVIAFALVALGFYVNQEKIYMYFVYGLRDEQARAHMYYTALLIYKDFFPFGPGFGTFATDSAAKFYSPLNYMYHLDCIWGLAIDDIANGKNFYNDTFYPVLAQFGVFGTFAYIAFWVQRWRESALLQSIKTYKLFLFMGGYIMIQCIAENTFTGSSSVPVMMIIGLCLSEKTTLVEEKGNVA